MEKKKYERPFMAIEQFVPNNYCSNCEEEKVLVSECADSIDHVIVFTVDAGSETEGNGGEVGSPGSNGHLFKTTQGYWAYAGRLEDGHYPDHYPMHQGEWMNITSGVTANAGDWYNESQGIKYCNCGFSTPSQHHHLIEKSFKPNRS